MIEIDIHNDQQTIAIDEARMRLAVTNVYADRQIQHGEVSLAVIGDEQMQQLNARFLNHDWPTDVLSFVHDATGDRLDGEIIVSADTAAREAQRFGWQPADELLLYVIHGALHLIGHDDHNDDDLADMRAAERRHLKSFGLSPRYADATIPSADPEGNR